MKRKLLSAFVATVMVVALLPAVASAVTPDEGTAGNELTYLYLDDEGDLPLDGDGTVADTSDPEAGWSYSDGVLTLNGYNGGFIGLGYSEVPKQETLTIELVGTNVINASRFGVHSGAGRDIVFRGSGTLVVQGYVAVAAIDVIGGDVRFDLGEGGEIQLKPTFHEVDDRPPLADAALMRPPSFVMQAAIVVRDETDTYSPFGEIDMIQLMNRNFVKSPKEGVAGVCEVQPEEMFPLEESPATPGEASADKDSGGTVKETASFATVLTASGSGTAAAEVTISGPVAAAEKPPVEKPEATAPGTVAKKEAPKTGDTGVMGMAVILIAACGVACASLIRRKFN